MIKRIFFSKRTRKQKETNMYNTESCLLSSEEKLIEKSAKADFRSNSDTQTMISQRYHSNIVECKSLLTSINEHENDHPIMVEKAETRQAEKCKNDKTASNIEMQNNLKENNTIISNEKPHQILKEVAKPTQKSLEESKRRKRTFSLLDSLISMSIIGPLAIGFWRGTWTCMDFHAELFPSWFCFTLGAMLHLAFAIFKNRFHDIYTNKWTELNWRKRLPYRMLQIMYTYAFGVACITHWRGGWIIIDIYLYTYVWITTTVMCLLLVCLAIFRCVRNLIATPYVIFIDVPSYVFQFPTRYNVVS